MPRKHERVPLSLEATLESSSGKQEARVSDLSLGGCYIDSIATVPAGEKVIVNIRMPTGEWLTLSGEVVHSFTNVGFGLRFVDMLEHQWDLLEKVIQDQGGRTFDYEDPEASREVIEPEADASDDE